MHSNKDIVVVSWNGVDEALRLIAFDAQPNFHILLYDYSGRLQAPQLPDGKIVDEFVSIKTEFKGALIHELAELLSNRPFRYIGFVDDDQSISVADLNRLIEEAQTLGADTFQPSITHKSHYSHPQFLQKDGHSAERVDWVEIMAPFIRKEILEEGRPFFKDNISSYGVDRYLFPYIQRKLGMHKAYLIHSVGLTHTKPVTDGSKKFSNGLDARQEGEMLRAIILKLINSKKIEFTQTELTTIYEVGMFRYQKKKYDLIRFINNLI